MSSLSYKRSCMIVRIAISSGGMRFSLLQWNHSCRSPVHEYTSFGSSGKFLSLKSNFLVLIAVLIRPSSSLPNFKAFFSSAAASSLP